MICNESGTLQKLSTGYTFILAGSTNNKIRIQGSKIGVVF